MTTKQIKEVARDEWPRVKIRVQLPARRESQIFNAIVKAGELAQECSPENTIEPQADAIQALSKMRCNNASRLMVVENEKLVGIIALKDMLEFLSLKIELDE